MRGGGEVDLWCVYKERDREIERGGGAIAIDGGKMKRDFLRGTLFFSSPLSL